MRGLMKDKGFLIKSTVHVIRADCTGTVLMIQCGVDSVLRARHALASLSMIQNDNVFLTVKCIVTEMRILIILIHTHKKIFKKFNASHLS